MRIAVTTQPLEKVRTGALVILLDEEGRAALPEHPALRGHVTAFARAVKSGKSRAEWFCTLEPSAGVATEHLLLDAAALTSNWMPGRERLKCAAARAVELCRKHSIARVAFALPTEGAEEFACAVLEGAALGDFSDTRFKSEAPKPERLRAEFVLPSPDNATKKALEGQLARKLAICEATNFARELVNAPSNVLTPEALAREARRIAPKRKKAKGAAPPVTILDEKQIRRQGYGLIDAVGRGSAHPPRLIVVRHRPPGKVARKAPHVVLLGKGICFDTGGLCVKPANSMHTMNGDMGGAGAVLGAMKAIVELKLPIRVTAIVPAATNAIDGEAYLPGNIVTSKSGKTVYVENTDAEGRLILADGIARAAEEKAEVLIDAATLTGAAQIALGPQYAALFTEDAELERVFREASARTGDDLWPLPFVREYESALAHPLADMNNIPSNGAPGGAIHAANFLKAFVPNGVRWAHLDMSAAARAKAKTRYINVGATGWGVRLLVEAVEALARDAS